MKAKNKIYKMAGPIKPIFFLTILAFIVYLFTSGGKTPYDYFTRLSDSFLQGKYYLTENPGWLSELIPAGQNKFYVAYPPMPAFLAMPFRFILGEKFQQQYLAHLLGAGIVALTMLSAWAIKKNKKLVIYMGLLAAFGNIIWFLSATGSSWYLGQVASAFFISGVLYEGLTKKRSFLMGMLFGAAFLSRINICVSIPVFLYILSGKDWFKNYLKFGLGILPFVLFNFGYNFIRFGVIWDKAYFVLPEILNETKTAWFVHGVTNISYIPNNLVAAFWSFPKIIKTFPYVVPSWYSLAIWITTPAFVFSFFAPLSDKLNRYLWISILLTFLVVAMHGGVGWAQFGYRFAVDFYPFIFILTAKGLAETKLKWYHYILLIISIAVNLWGVTFINKFGWVSY